MKINIQFKKKKKTYIKKLQNNNFKIKEDNFDTILVYNLDFITNYYSNNDYWLKLVNKKCNLCYINLEDIEGFIIK